MSIDTSSSRPIHAILVSPASALTSSGGGVQLCTSEYSRILREAGVTLTSVSFDTDSCLRAKLLRRSTGRPYRYAIPPGVADRVKHALRQNDYHFVFFNLEDYTYVVRSLRREGGWSAKFVHLSHGLASTDVCVRQQAKRLQRNDVKLDTNAAVELGARLQWEADYRQQLDGCLCLTSLDAELEKWLGAPATEWFPRAAMNGIQLPLEPIDGRVGCVATLDHPPNYIGLSRCFDAISRIVTPAFSFRLAGGPEREGIAFARRFPFVHYLGRPSDRELAEEAKTWCCFAHPIFDYARGCSTKVAVALGWGLPIATTVFGARGYIWDDRVLPLAATESDLARMLVARSDLRAFDTYRLQTRSMFERQPRDRALAARVRDFLLSLLAGRSLALGETQENDNVC